MFVGDVLDVRCTLPLVLLPAHAFDRATLLEAEFIRDFLDRRPVNPIFPPWARYEVEHVGKDEPSGATRYVGRPLLPSEHRYYVIRYTGTNVHSQRISYAAAISDLELTFPLELVRAQGGVGWISHPIIFNHFYLSVMPPPSILVNEEALSQISRIFERMGKIEQQHPAVLRAIEMFASLNLLPPQSEFQVLGLFAIIELLITHAPRVSEQGDSIKHQVRTKIPLLSRHANYPFDYRAFFGQCNEDTVWSKLYDYRSSIAHGGLPSFEKDLQMLNSRHAVVQFLRYATKSLLRYALEEPQMYADLKKC